ncbi:hypothetical protein KO493_07075 [Tamlana agarivorans]|uniref:Uncharacterized protein n=1 Tax=Pseudotamlana agarivorans TaxID=481183 RepID=A0ACC5U879_9FLAO|nr:LamG-like jellyroll fold domain-containing protein [Tamlana agarivorans]MBU2950453.1 hypothetical protein [Tamlana agarivorans]
MPTPLKNTLALAVFIFLNAGLLFANNITNAKLNYIKPVQTTTVPSDIVITSDNGTSIETIGNGDTTTSTQNNTHFSDVSIDPITSGLTYTYTITNNGPTDVLLRQNQPRVRFSSSSGNFTVSSQPLPDTRRIAAGDSKTFQITFKPRTGGNHQETVEIAIFDSNTVLFTFTFVIAGRGTSSSVDTDGDGVFNNADLDSDNDGLLNTDEDLLCNQNPNAIKSTTTFLKETFGAGTSIVEIDANYPGAYTDYAFQSTGNVTRDYYAVNKQSKGTFTNNNLWYRGGDHTGDANGRMAIFDVGNGDNHPAYDSTTNPNPSNIFYQITITGVEPGVPTSFSLAALNLIRATSTNLIGNETEPELIITINDTDINGIEIIKDQTGEIAFNTTDLNGDPDTVDASKTYQENQGWITHSISFTPTSDTFLVTLTTANKRKSGNDIALDDITITQDYCDSDGDGIADFLDLDNDNDGMPNVAELQLSGVNISKGMLDISNDDSNNNGVHDSFEGGAIAIDTDGDGAPDHLDLDSDNDGVFDVYEYDGKGDLDVSGDGVSEGTDVDSGVPADGFDGDGILAGADDLDGFGLTNYIPAIDSGGDSTPDYLTPQSDGTNNDIPEIYAHLDPDGDGVIDVSTDIDRDGIADTLDSDVTVVGSPRDLDDSYSLYFDGRNDYVETPQFLNNTSDGTMMCWIKIDPSATGGQYIMGQENISFISNGSVVDFFVNGNLVGNTSVTKGKWIHLAGSYSSSGEYFYVNGEEIAKASNNMDLDGTGTSFIIGRSPANTTSYFQGEIDEVRVFNEALTQEEIQRMMCQELDENNNFTIGKIIPREISPSLSTSLIRYYKMDTYTDDQLIDLSPSGIDATIYNVKEIYFQRAPLPYETVMTGTNYLEWGDESSWLHGDVWSINDRSVYNDAAIVRIRHDFRNRFSGRGENLTQLGLIVDPDTDFIIHTRRKLENTWYLDIGDNGLIDLHADGQLIQTEESTLGTGNGVIERDQEGTLNKYSYNYWSSPVNTDRTNATYTVGGVLLEGNADHTTVNSIDFVGGYDGNDTTSPKQIAEYWINIFPNGIADNYWDWKRVYSTGIINVGEGYTMKGTGTGPITDEQVYLFEGSPNNGDYTLKINSGREYLIGNPYPSAIDSYAFLDDNKTSIAGSLYYWEHYGGTTHFLADYEGSYATYNYSGTSPSVTQVIPSYPPINSSPTPRKTPGRYIPVAQGFFVEADQGGDIKFHNSQRVFEIERNNSESVFIKETNTKTSKTTNVKTGDTRPKIRLKYSSPLGYQRQLLTTVDTSATQNVDWGYDAKLIEDLPEDMSWEIENEKYVIQGIDTIEASTILPLIVKTREKASDNGGIVTFSIDSLQNDAQNYNVYLKDFDTYHDLKQAPYDATVGKGETIGRFALAFSDQTLNIEEESNKLGVKLFYNKQNTSLIINNPKNTTLKSLTAVNTLGQMVYSKQLNTSENRLEIPTHLATGLYVFSVQTENIELSKKVIVAE